MNAPCKLSARVLYGSLLPVAFRSRLRLHVGVRSPRVESSALEKGIRNAKKAREGRKTRDSGGETEREGAGLSLRWPGNAPRRGGGRVGGTERGREGREGWRVGVRADGEEGEGRRREGKKDCLADGRL